MKNFVAAAAALILVPVFAPAASAASVLTWKPCPTNAEPTAECSTVTVPIDRSRPGAGTATLALSRLPATDPAHRVGSLLFNPGGPGAGGAGFVQNGLVGFADPAAYQQLRQHFDLVGFDPRGTGESIPKITCGPNLWNPAVNHRPVTRRDYDALLASNRAAAADCLRLTGPMLGQADTVDVAQDVDVIRRSLGEDKISWLGLSYGTELGAIYAALYPGHVRTMVLDGAVDHATPMRTGILQEAAATEDEFRRFAAWCAGSPDCVLRGQDVGKLYDDLTAEGDRSGVWSSKLGRKVSGEEIADGVYGVLYLRQFWPVLAKELAMATAPDPDAGPLTETASFADDYAPYVGIGCQDFPSPFTGPADFAVTGALVKAVAPHTWRYQEFWDVTTTCTGWSVPAKNPPGPRPVHGAPPILVVGGEHDPATPMPQARTLAASIDRSVLLTRSDDGHTGWYNTACARAAEVKYLVSGVTPARGTVCP